MKSLYESILDVDDNINKIDKDIVSQIKQFIKDNFKGYVSCKISKSPNKDGKYEVSSNKTVEVRNRSITSFTNGLFIWTKVGIFNCSYCNSLTSLEGSPIEVGNFNCMDCGSLTSLKGAPEKVKYYFNCMDCRSLTSLEGSPKEIGEDFNLEFCNSLKSLEGSPKEIGGDFVCKNCGKKFTEEDVRKVSNVKKNIYC